MKLMFQFILVTLSFILVAVAAPQSENKLPVPCRVRTSVQQCQVLPSTNKEHKYEPNCAVTRVTYFSINQEGIVSEKSFADNADFRKSQPYEDTPNNRSMKELLFKGKLEKLRDLGVCR